jgi:hypothetical protein
MWHICVTLTKSTQIKAWRQGEGTAATERKVLETPSTVHRGHHSWPAQRENSPGKDTAHMCAMKCSRWTTSNISPATGDNRACPLDSTKREEAGGKVGVGEDPEVAAPGPLCFHTLHTLFPYPELPSMPRLPFF